MQCSKGNLWKKAYSQPYLRDSILKSAQQSKGSLDTLLGWFSDERRRFTEYGSRFEAIARKLGSLNKDEFSSLSYDLLIAVLGYTRGRKEGPNQAEMDAAHESTLPEMNNIVSEYLSSAGNDPKAASQALSTYETYVAMMRELNEYMTEYGVDSQYLLGTANVDEVAQRIGQAIGEGDQYVDETSNDDQPEQTKQAEPPKPATPKDVQVLRQQLITAVANESKNAIENLVQNFSGSDLNLDSNSISRFASDMVGKVFDSQFDRNSYNAYVKELAKNKDWYGKLTTRIGKVSKGLSGFIVSAAVRNSVKQNGSGNFDDISKKAGELSAIFAKYSTAATDILGEKFLNGVISATGNQYPSANVDEMVSESAKKVDSSFSTAQKKMLFINFYDAIKDFFITYLNPPGNEVIPEMFRNFSSADSPFEKIPGWLKSRYEEVKDKDPQTMTPGDRQFLQMYSSKDPMGTAMQARGIVDGLVSELEQRLRKEPYRAIPINERVPGGPESEKINVNEMVDELVNRLMVVVKNAAQGQSTDWKALRSSSNRFLVMSQETPIIPEVPQSILTLPPTTGPNQSPAPVPVNETVDSGKGLAYGSLMVAISILSDLRVRLDDVEENIKLVDEEPPSSEGDQEERIRLIR